MKRITLLSIILLTLYGSEKLSAQNRITGKIKTEIASPITVTESEPLNFGKIINRADGGRVIISPTGIRESIGNVRGFGNDFYSAGKFIITGPPNLVLDLNLPDGDQFLYSEINAMKLVVRNFESSPPTTSQIHIPNQEGRLELGIGATLYVSSWSANPPGIYTGIYEIVITYN